MVTIASSGILVVGLAPTSAASKLVYVGISLPPATFSSAPVWVITNYGSTKKQTGGSYPQGSWLFKPLLKIWAIFQLHFCSFIYAWHLQMIPWEKKEVTDDTNRDLTCVGMDLILGVFLSLFGSKKWIPLLELQHRYSTQNDTISEAEDTQNAMASSVIFGKSISRSSHLITWKLDVHSLLGDERLPPMVVNRLFRFDILELLDSQPWWNVGVGNVKARGGSVGKLQELRGGSGDVRGYSPEI